MEQHTKPCATCPFRRSITPGELGGSAVFTYVGQTEAGFAIPCHCCIDFDDPDWKAKASVPGAVKECAGAAIYRSNIGKPNPVILVLPEDTETVFGSHAELIAHHERVRLDSAKEFLEMVPPSVCADIELSRSGVVVTRVEK